jgi:hypothetical protein
VEFQRNLSCIRTIYDYWSHIYVYLQGLYGQGIPAVVGGYRKRPSVISYFLLLFFSFFFFFFFFFGAWLQTQCLSRARQVPYPSTLPLSYTPSTLLVSFFLMVGFELRASFLLLKPPCSFCDGYFRDRVARTICPSWLLTAILITVS